MEPNEADRTALEWYKKKYPNSSLFADEDGPGSQWYRDRQLTVDGFIAGMRAERERCAKIALDEFLIPIEFWQGTKKELTAEFARRIAAAIRGEQ